MKRCQVFHFRFVIVFALSIPLIYCTACGKSEILYEADYIVQSTQAEPSLEERIHLSFLAQDFSYKILELISAAQIGNLIESRYVNDMLTHVRYIPTEHNEEDSGGHAYSYITLHGDNYIVSTSLGNTWYELVEIRRVRGETNYTISELRGANYLATLFITIRDGVPYIIAELSGFACIVDNIDNDTYVIASTIGTLPNTTIHIINFDKEIIYSANLNDHLSAKTVVYDSNSKVFECFFEPNQPAIKYSYHNFTLQQIS